MIENILLNEKQKESVNHKDGPMMVLAGPGSGKTTVIIYRIKQLIDFYKINPKDILVITFTKSAADEMKNRFNNICENINYNVMFSTFHSYFFRIIRNYFGYKVLNVLREDEKKNIIKSIVLNLQIEFQDEEEFINNIINEISFIKNELIDINFYNSTNCASSDFKSIFKLYEDFKEDNQKIDFDDMLIKCYNLLNDNKNILETWKNRYKYTLIDEFQDINKVQYECIKKLTNKNSNLFIVGDDDQSIYKFRGSRPDFLLKFPKDFENVKKIILDINYRSTNEIIKLSNIVIKFNKNRYKKIIKGTGIKGKMPVLIKTEDTSQEANAIAKKIKQYEKTTDLENIAVIYRTNLQSRAFVDIFMDYNISFQVKDIAPSIYDHWIAKDIFAYLKLSIDKTLNKEAERIINRPKRYINKFLITEAKTYLNETNTLLNSLYSLKSMKNWQISKLEDLIIHLNTLKKKDTYSAFKYIRKIIGYDEYLIEYSNYRNINSKGLFEIIEELQESSKNYEKKEDFLNHAEDVIFETKQQIKNHNTVEKGTGVVLSTMHSVKGLEFDIVFVASAVEGVVPYEKSITDEEIEEERRLFYVALTRAKKILFISIIKTRHDKEVKPTRFLNKFIKL